MVGREGQVDNDLFYACGLVEYIGRQTHNRRSAVISALGPERLKRIVDFADVLHCENIDAVAARFVDEAGIGEGSFDNVSCARYGVPSYWDMGKVYKRLAVGIMPAADALAEAFRSPIAPLIDDYNGSFFYEAPANILTAHLTGVIE